MAWFILGMIAGIVLCKYMGLFWASRPRSYDREEIVEICKEMFTAPPDGVEKMALISDIEDILNAMKAQVGTDVAAPERDKSLQKKDKPAPKLTKEEKKIAKKRSTNYDE